MVVASIMSEKREGVKVLFVYSSLSTFVRTDLDILRTHFTVKSMKATTFLVPKPGRNPLIFPRLLKEVWWADVVYTWFADLNAFFLVLFSIVMRKKIAIVVGGYDVAKIPEISYGLMLRPISAEIVKFAVEHADLVLPFSEYAKDEVLNITKEANLKVATLACDIQYFKPGKGAKEDVVLTVCDVKNENIARKGLITFLESARLIPEINFVLVGRHKDDSIDYLRKISPKNVRFTGYVSDKELIRWYQKAKVYCQLSYQEGFGVAVIEAMACECVPVVSLKAGVLRETVGDCGFYVPYGEAEATAKAIKKALSAHLDLGVKLRKRVEDFFSIEKREKKLLESIYNMFAQIVAQG